MAEFITIFGYLIYLEILELNCCGLGANKRSNIMNKVEKEFNNINEDISEDINENILNEDEEKFLYVIGNYKEMVLKNSINGKQ